MARVLSLEEVRKLQFQTQQWMEFRMSKPQCCGCWKQYFLKGHMAKDRAPYYNDWWRVWDSQPTPEERKEVKWKCQISCPAHSVDTKSVSTTIWMEK